MPYILLRWKNDPDFLRKWPRNVLADPCMCQFDLPMEPSQTPDWLAHNTKNDHNLIQEYKNYLYIWSCHINGCLSFFCVDPPLYKDSLMGNISCCEFPNVFCSTTRVRNIVEHQWETTLTVVNKMKVHYKNLCQQTYPSEHADLTGIPLFIFKKVK